MTTLARRPITLCVAACLLALSGCDLIGIEPASAAVARKEAEGKAIGGACRHAGRAIEDCYTINKKADKGAVFAGWREMNDYMRENKIDEVKPMVAAAPAAPAGHTESVDEQEPAPDKKKAAKH